MAIIKKNDFKKMSKTDMEKKLADLQKELMKANSQRAASTLPENPGRVKEVRRTIARIHQKLAEVQPKQ